jgi:hypothetical protein
VAGRTCQKFNLATLTRQNRFDDDAYFSSLVNMFAQVLKIAAHLFKEQRDNYLKRLGEVTNISNNLGDCIGSVMTDLLEDYQFDA